MVEHRLGETEGTRGVERRDTRPRNVVIAGLTFFVVVLAVSLAAGPFIGWLTREPPAQPVIPGMLERAGPPLLVEPEERLTEMRQRNVDQLTGTAWVDRDAGIARIPIIDAMDILAERGWQGPAPQSPPRRMMPLPNRRDAADTTETEEASQ